jgi:hypothetical protein
MGSNDVRRLCGIAIGLGLWLTSPTEAFATRGRPKIVNNTPNDVGPATLTAPRAGCLLKQTC